jgi:hypothetical protein
MENRESIKPLLMKEFDFLHQYGFQFLSYGISKNKGGYWKIRFQSNICLLMVYNEEDQAFILFSPLDATSDERYSMEKLVHYISAGQKFIGYYKGDTSNWEIYKTDISNWRKQIEWIANILREYLNQIITVMNDLPKHREGIEKLEKEYDIKSDEDFRKTYPRQTD